MIHSDSYSDMNKSRYSSHSQQLNVNKTQFNQPSYFSKQYNNNASHHVVRNGNRPVHINSHNQINSLNNNSQSKQITNSIPQNIHIDYITTNTMSNRPSLINNINHQSWYQNTHYNQNKYTQF